MTEKRFSKARRNVSWFVKIQALWQTSGVKIDQGIGFFPIYRKGPILLEHLSGPSRKFLTDHQQMEKKQVP